MRVGGREGTKVLKKQRKNLLFWGWAIMCKNQVSVMLKMVFFNLQVCASFNAGKDFLLF